jgi:hypothetical protein
MIKWILAFCLVSLSVIACHADGWRMDEGLVFNDGTPTTNAITAYAAGRCGPHQTFSPSCYTRFADCKGSDLDCAMTLHVECVAQRYKLSIVWPCPACGSNLSGPTTVNVVIDMKTERQFQLRGNSDDDGVVEAALDAEQIRALSQSNSIMVTATGRSIIYTESRGTDAAFAWLAAACKIGK